MAASLAVVLLLGQPAIANTLPGPPEPGLHGSLDGSAEYSGHADRLQLSGALSAQWYYYGLAIFATSQGAHGTVAGERYKSSHFHHLRARVPVYWRLMVEAYGQHSADAFRAIRSRSLAGGGLRVGGAMFSAGLGAFHETEQLESSTVRAIRASAYVDLQTAYKIFALTVTAFFQPRVGLWQDRRALVDGCLGISLVDWLSVKFNASIVYNTQPPAGVDSVSVESRASVGVRW